MLIRVAAGENLQAALDRAVAGDVVALQSGATFAGQFRLPAKSGVVRLTSDTVLPNRRITPADAPLLATLVSPYGQHAIDGYDTKNWKIEGIRFLPNLGGYGEVLGFYRAENIYLDRILLAVPDTLQQKRGILGNGKNITLTRSYLSGIWRTGQDSQAFCAFDGAGPYTITDNYLEAASENVMFGGADSTTAADIPSDILVEGNTFNKPLSWKGTPHVVKNLFELKNAKRVVIRHNLFMNNWIDGQSGAAIVFTPRNQNGKNPWTVLEDILFEDNDINNTPNGISILGIDDLAASGRSNRITIRRNNITVTGTYGVMVGGEAGTVSIVDNDIKLPVVAAADSWKAQPLRLYKGRVFPTGETLRDAKFAVLDLLWADNVYTTPSCIFGDQVGCGPAAFSLAEKYSLTMPVVTPPPAPDPLAELKAEVALLALELAAVKVWKEKVIKFFEAFPK
jgi:hypothetical protein